MAQGGRTPDAASPAYMVSAAMAVLCVAILSPGNRTLFHPYFGQLPPIAVVVAAAAAGFGSLLLLAGRGMPAKGGRRPGDFAIIFALATAMAAVTVFADLTGGFPTDLNVPVPEALLFYPAMGFVAECIFHLAPLAALLHVFSKAGLSRATATTAAIIVTASIEPLFQVRAELITGAISGLGAFVLIHNFAFNITELEIFRRRGFAAMFTFRLTYYLWWHIVWGAMRLT